MNDKEITFEDYSNACNIISKYIAQQKNSLIYVERHSETIPNFGLTLDSKISDLDIDIGLWNSLLYGTKGLIKYDSKIKDLSLVSISEFRKSRNVGKAKIDRLLSILEMFKLNYTP